MYNKGLYFNVDCNSAASSDRLTAVNTIYRFTGVKSTLINKNTVEKKNYMISIKENSTCGIKFAVHKTPRRRSCCDVVTYRTALAFNPFRYSVTDWCVKSTLVIPLHDPTILAQSSVTVVFIFINCLAFEYKYNVFQFIFRSRTSNFF